MPDDHSSHLSRIFLVGFMGAGKTTVGRELAPLLGFRFVDLDEIIEQREGMLVREIFSERGEVAFRRAEHDAIRDCKAFDSAVIALGGGSFVSEQNRAAVAELGKAVWLECPLDICLSRLGCDPSRPMLGDRRAMESLLEKRRQAYSTADFIIHCENRPPREIALEIVSIIKS